MRMGKWIAGLLAATLLLGLTGCGKAAVSESEQALTEWLAQAKLDGQETPEQLYEAALEEDTLVVYSTTTRIYQVKESFEAAYPGLTVEVYDTRAHDMVEALLHSYENREWNCDVVICSDDNGNLTSELLPLHIVNKYVPYDIAPALREEANEQLLYFVGEMEQLFYNTEVYDKCPIDNWWELTEPQWQGKVYMNSPLRSFPAYSLVHSVIANSDKMAEAYLLRYGKPLEVPEGSNAGKLFWEKLVQNGVHFTTSSNELVEVVGTAGQADPPLAFMISSKTRRNNVGLQVGAAYGVTPCDGVYAPNSVSIAGGAKNISSAKLFIRWLLGETDGTGEGLKPYLLDGTWPVRTDVQTQSPVTIEDGNFWFNQKDDVIAREDEILEFWIGLQQEELK